MSRMCYLVEGLALVCYYGTPTANFAVGTYSKHQAPCSRLRIEYVLVEMSGG